MEQVTGIILAGGRGSRMGGVDKGLERFQGQPLAFRAMMRLIPQVSEVLINANRNIGVYEGFGVTVLPDPIDGYQGPLAGMLSGLPYTETEFLQAVPCDVPNFPSDLVSRLHEGLVSSGMPLAYPVTIEADGTRQPHPVFLLMRAEVHDSLLVYLQQGGRKIDRWTSDLGAAEVVFPDPAAFFNANTVDELRALEAPGAPGAPGTP
jgi:molybdopterin-guanine dinucleotide biosynthesis protein A